MVLITNAIAWLVVGDVDGAMNVGVVTSLQKTGTYSEHHSPVTLDDLIRYCQ